MSFNFPPCQRDEKTLTHLVEPMPSDGVELMYRMLEYDPARRVGMDECLQHAYLKTLRSVPTPLPPLQPPVKACHGISGLVFSMLQF